MENAQEQYKGKGALDAFLNLLSLVTLVWLSISFGSIVFQIINKYLSHPVFGYRGSFNLSALKFNVASVIIVAPVCLLAIAALHKHYKEQKLSAQRGIHRWLTYLMLFVAVCNIVGSLIALVYTFLNGEYTAASLLKIATVFLIAAGIFGYYWYDLKRSEYTKRSLVSVGSLYAVIVLTVLSVVGGFIVVGSPLTARKLNFDQRRVNDLSSLKYQLEEYYRQKEAIPADLSAPQFSQFKDPETLQPYEYRAVDAKNYEVCAVFALPADVEINKQSPIYYPAGSDEWYYHKAGRQCFQIKVQDLKDSSGNPVPLPARVGD